MTKIFQKTSLFLVGLSGCVMIPPPLPVERMPQASESVLNVIFEKKPKCGEMVEKFCEELYNPKFKGKMHLGQAGADLEIKRGLTSNDFPQSYYEYSRTQIQQQSRLPPDFRNHLEKQEYFSKLKYYLARKPTSELSLEESIRFNNLASQVDRIWRHALDATTLTRMEKNFPDFSKLSDDRIPPELSRERKRIRATLLAEIAKAVWANHRNWKKVEDQFAEVKSAYEEFFKDYAYLPDSLRSDWKKRIQSVKLVIPRSDPSIDMSNCDSTAENAFYYTYQNVMTVCPGDFNSEDMRQTIAHELAHSLDNDRSLYLQEKQSNLGKNLDILKRQNCGLEKISCNQWASFKENLDGYLEEIENYELQLPEFHSCLQTKKPDGTLSASRIEKIAKDEATRAISEFATEKVFLSLISEKIPMPDGQSRNNPMYQKPCAYSIWETDDLPIDDSYHLLLFFNSEYRCSSEPQRLIKFEKAIETARRLYEKMVISRISREREYSPRQKLFLDNQAASVSEKFADRIAALAFSYILKKEPSLSKRRALYLANNAWTCSQPSVEKYFTEEAGFQTSLSFSLYPQEIDRRKSFLTKEIQNALHCENDVSRKECFVFE